MLISTLKLAGVAASGAASAVSAANTAADDMISELKSSDNATINRVGRVLEGTKAGFLIGYVSPSIVTGIGVALTTGDLAAALTGAVSIIANPVAGVCAAVGAVYFGWNALSSDEKSAIIDSVCKFLKVGEETVKAVVSYTIRLMKELLSADNIAELKQTVSTAVESVGRHLSDITHSLVDKIDEVSSSVKATFTIVVDTVLVRRKQDKGDG